MSDMFNPMDLFSGFAQGMAGAGAAMQNQQQAMMNYKLQEEQLAYMKEAQQTTWNREDTAVQRRTADLKAAGLNPVLAAGGAAQTSAPVRVDAPQMRADPFGAAASAMTAVQSLHQSAAQVDLLRQQAANAAEQRRGVQLDNNLKEATLEPKTQQVAAEAKYAVESLASRVQEAWGRGISAEAQAQLDNLQWLIQSADPSKGEYSPTLAGKVAVARAALLDAQKAATDQGIEYSKAQTAALAYAVQKAGMDAGVLKELGVPPLVIDAVMRLLGTAAAVIR